MPKLPLKSATAFDYKGQVRNHKQWLISYLQSKFELNRPIFSRDIVGARKPGLEAIIRLLNVFMDAD